MKLSPQSLTRKFRDKKTSKKEDKDKLHTLENKRLAKDQPNTLEVEAIDLAHLQDHLGNQATQQLLARRVGGMVQRQAAGGAGFNPLDPAVMEAAARTVIAQNEAPVRQWLDENLGRLRLLPVAEIVARIRQEVPEAVRLADGELERLAQAWAHEHGFMLSAGPLPELPGRRLSIELPEAVRRAFSIATDGVSLIRQPNGRLNIAVSGATLALGSSRVKLAWDGSIGFEIPYQEFHFGGRVSPAGWELILSIPNEGSVPDLTELTRVFQEAEAALRRMVEATAQFQNLDDVGAVRAAIDPHINDVKEAIQTLREIAALPRFHVALTARGPFSGGEAAPESGGKPEGVEIIATVTFRF